jgi:N,N'-diacetyllegionaminate synthase
MKTEIVAEIGSNWEGNISKANSLIKECKKAGANAVKFQMWRADDLYKKDNPNYKEISKSELTFEKAKKIKKICDDLKIEFFCSVFYPEAVEFLENLGVKRYKVASWTSKLGHKFAKETLEKKASTKKPMIVSMGMGGNIKLINKILRKNSVTMCYCISEYPLLFEKINWKKAITFNGFSDHTLGIIAPIVFTMLKKQSKAKKIIIEKHVKLKSSKGPDASTSIDTEQLSEMVSSIRLIEKVNL